MNRRDFLEIAGGSALGPLLRRTAAPAGLDRIGLQLYTVRDLMQADVQRTLEQVAAVGYREVEFAGYFGTPPARLRRWLTEAGLSAPSAHVPLQELRENPEALLDAGAECGHRYLVLAWMPPAERTTLDSYRRVAALLNQSGARARARGMAMAYHNHDFEFARIEGAVPYQLLLAETDAALVRMEVDLYWMTKAGQDVLRYLDGGAGRFELCHIKDMDWRGNMADVGAGHIDFRAILGRGTKAGLRHFFVERDDPPEPLASIRASYRHLRQLVI